MLLACQYIAELTNYHQSPCTKSKCIPCLLQFQAFSPKTMTDCTRKVCKLRGCFTDKHVAAVTAALPRAYSRPPSANQLSSLLTPHPSVLHRPRHTRLKQTLGYFPTAVQQTCTHTAAAKRTKCTLSVLRKYRSRLLGKLAAATYVPTGFRAAAEKKKKNATSQTKYIEQDKFDALQREPILHEAMHGWNQPKPPTGPGQKRRHGRPTFG